ncbi:hypothetical protein BDZ45DRAFT_730346 [Acephala macrosclerotiorum]|nr:hypothetical protein BDZ45DRAFT_730346 [Acephala macrosclerotiorum]
MRPQHLLLLPLTHIPLISAHLIKLNLNIREPTFPETSSAAALPLAPTSPAQILQECAACQVVSSALSVCASLTPSFTALQPTAQAKCLCYSSMAWSPNIFDSPVQSCADYASTAAPPAYGALSNLENFCGNIGDVNKPVTVFSLAPTAGGGSGSGTGNGGLSSVPNYVPAAITSAAASPSPTMTGYGSGGASSSATNTSSVGAGNTAGTVATPTPATGNGGQGSVSPSKTMSETDITISVGGAGTTATNTGAAKSMTRIVLPEENIIWFSFVLALLLLFLWLPAC